MSALITDDELFQMTNVRSPRSSGLPANCWIGPRGHARHAARIKVQMNHNERFEPDNLAVVSIAGSGPPPGHRGTARQ